MSKRIVIGIVLLICLSIMPDFAEAKAYSDLPSGIVVGDDQGIKIDNDGQYLVDIRDVAPGKKWSTKITIINMEKDSPYRLTMSVSKPTLVKGSLDLSKAIQLTLIYEEKEIYKGPLSGINETMNLQDKLTPLELGLFRSGDTKMLEANFELDGKKYTNKDFSQKNIVEMIWKFKAVKTTLPDTGEPEKPDHSFVDKIINKFRLPNTGEDWRNALLFSCIGLFLILIILLIIKHKKSENNKSKKKKK
ncbi:hypothetical protein DOK67_0001593 [Enterococcus sp. DIV0212c]|uniref:hypothetical protein n=1 Tax=Enterococcus sp. DIV0212c TaxID=2230867 RepID=UPI001A9AC670|nr:hypothetical protein [Enterococcus sp. DIV0212c]MBO1354201.1 hypothetical protein [Enterococcus sp. DIV0212c]